MKENLGLDWLDRMVAGAQSEPMFEDSKWDRILAELGRISVYAETLSFNLKFLLITLEKPQDLSGDTSPYSRTSVSKVIKKCGKALDRLESDGFEKQPVLAALFADCRQQLKGCEELRERRNELIHALWVPQAFQPDSVTRLGLTKPNPGGVAEMKPQEHNVSELRATALEIRNLAYPLHSLTIKLRVAFQRGPTA